MSNVVRSDMSGIKKSRPRFDDADMERFDGAIENAVTGMGDPNYDKSAHYRVGKATRLTHQQQEELFESSWVCRKICEAYPLEATREWIDITLGDRSDPKLSADFLQYQEELGLREAFARAQTWANIYKGAAIILYINDGRAPDQPVNRNNIKSIEGLDVLDALDVRPSIVQSWNPLKPDYYEIVDTTTTNRKTNEGIPKFHPDRVIRFDGCELTPRAMRRNHNWGASLLDNVYSAFARYEGANNAIANMIADFNVFVYSLKGLSELIESSDDNNLVKLRNRLRAMRVSMSHLKGLVLDAEGEKAEFISRNFAGLADLAKIFRDELVGASGLPHNGLFGDSAGGLGSTGDLEAQTWAKLVEQFQERQFRRKLRRKLDYIWLAKDGPTKGKIPDDWNFVFKSLIQESEADKVALRSQQATIDTTYLSAGVLLKDEVRISRFGGSDYSIETTLDEAAWKKAQEADQFDLSQFGIGDETGGMPATGEDPNATAPEAGAPQEQIAPQTPKQDSADARKRVEVVQGLPLDITHDVGDRRFGKPMLMGYGRIRGSYGHAEDGRAIDVYLGPDLTSKRWFKVHQIDPETKFHDESKLCLNFSTPEQCRDYYVAQMGRDRLGAIQEVKPSDYAQYREDKTSPRNDEGVTSRGGNLKPKNRSRTRAETSRASSSKRSTNLEDDNSDRVDAKGKACGEGWISADKECHAGNGKKVAATVAGAALVAGAAGLAIAAQSKSSKSNPKNSFVLLDRDPGKVPENYEFDGSNFSVATANYSPDTEAHRQIKDVFSGALNDEKYRAALQWQHGRDLQAGSGRSMVISALKDGEPQTIVKGSIGSGEVNFSGRPIALYVEVKMPKGISPDGLPDDWMHQIFEQHPKLKELAVSLEKSQGDDDRMSRLADEFGEALKSTRIRLKSSDRQSKDKFITPQQSLEEYKERLREMRGDMQPADEEQLKLLRQELAERQNRNAKGQFTKGSKASATPAPTSATAEVEQSKGVKILSAHPEKVRTLGTGTYGQVWLTPDNTAYKQFYLSNGYDPEETRNLDRMAQLGIAPRLLGIHRAGKGYEMEYLENYQPISSLPTSSNGSIQLKYRAWVDSALEAFSLMHLNGIAHMDIHDNNILYNPADKTVKIIDFGLSKSHDFDADTSDAAHLRLQTDIRKIDALLSKITYDPETDLSDTYRDYAKQIKKAKKFAPSITYDFLDSLRYAKQPIP